MKIIPLAVAVLFLFNSAVYGTDIADRLCLRAPVGRESTYNRIAETIKIWENQGLGAIGNFSIQSTSYNDKRKALSVRLLDIERPQRGVESINISAQRAAPGEINEILQQLMVMSANPMLGRIIRWYTEEFVRSGDALILEDNSRGILGLGARNVVAVSQYLRDNPIAWFHEIAHAYFDEHPREISRIESQLVEGRAKWINIKDQSIRTHYVLRAFQRQIFGEQDKYLTQLVNNIGKVRKAVTQGELFYLGDNSVRLEQLIPLAEAMESVLAQADDTKDRIAHEGWLSIDVGGYIIDNPGARLLDIVIRDESGSEIAVIKVQPLKKADGLSYDKSAVFLEWISIVPLELRNKGYNSVLYEALEILLADLGYHEIYSHLKWGVESYWEKRGWKISEENIYIPGAIPGFYIEKPSVMKSACPTITGLYKKVIASSVSQPSYAESARGSLLHVFSALTQHENINGAFTEEEIAGLTGRAPSTVRYDIRALLTLGLLEPVLKEPKRGTYRIPELLEPIEIGINVYKIPARVKSRVAEIKPYLAMFRGDLLRPTRKQLEPTKQELDRIRAIEDIEEVIMTIIKGDVPHYWTHLESYLGALRGTKNSL